AERRGLDAAAKSARHVRRTARTCAARLQQPARLSVPHGIHTAFAGSNAARGRIRRRADARGYARAARRPLDAALARVRRTRAESDGACARTASHDAVVRAVCATAMSATRVPWGGRVPPAG